MRYFATIGADAVPVERTAEGVVIDGSTVEFEAEVIGEGDAHFRLPGRSARVRAEPTPAGWRIRIGSSEWTVRLESERARAIRELTGQEASVDTSDLSAPMPGLIVKVLIEEGQSVEAGDGLIVVEAMKMENELRAVGPGVVTRVEVAPGDTVERGQILIRFEASA